MSITLSKNNALRLAQISAVASKDDGRPTIQAVHLSFNELGVLVATATDSYRLAVMTIQGTEWDDDDYLELLVPAKEFGDAIKGILKLAPKDEKDPGIQLVPSTLYTHQVDVHGYYPDGPEVTVKDETGASTFPDVAQLFGGQTMNGIERFNTTEMRVVAEGTMLPTFAGGYMADMDKLHGTTQVLKKGMSAWQMSWIPKTSDFPHNAGYQPWVWASKDKEETIGICYMQMPINPNRRN